jgi:hypothetical protein
MVPSASSSAENADNRATRTFETGRTGYLDIHRQRRLVRKILFLFTLGFPPSQVR